MKIKIAIICILMLMFIVINAGPYVLKNSVRNNISIKVYKFERSNTVEYERNRDVSLPSQGAIQLNDLISADVTSFYLDTSFINHSQTPYKLIKAEYKVWAKDVVIADGFFHPKHPVRIHTKEKGDCHLPLSFSRDKQDTIYALKNNADLHLEINYSIVAKDLVWPIEQRFPIELVPIEEQ